MTAKRVLVHLRHADERISLEALDVALVAGVFDQQVSVLLSGGAVEHLAAHPDDSPVGRLIETLPDYGVQMVGVCRPSLINHAVQADHYLALIRLMTPAEQTELLSEQDMVVGD